MLKPIPQEQPSGNKQNAGSKKKKSPTHFMRLEVKLQNLAKGDSKLFAAASRQLLEYMKKAEKASLKELNELIHNLQRTVIGLQKKRIDIVRNEQRRKKKGQQ